MLTWRLYLTKGKINGQFLALDLTKLPVWHTDISQSQVPKRNRHEFLSTCQVSSGESRVPVNETLVGNTNSLMESLLRPVGSPEGPQTGFAAGWFCFLAVQYRHQVEGNWTRASPTEPVCDCIAQELYLAASLFFFFEGVVWNYTEIFMNPASSNKLRKERATESTSCSRDDVSGASVEVNVR